MTVIDLNGSEFETFIASNKVVVVDCWAPWCGPCRRMGPEVAKAADLLDGRVAFAKLNTDENQAIAAKFNINAIPTLLIFVNGQQKDSLVGLRPADTIIDELGQYLE